MDDDNARLLIQYESQKKRVGIAYFLLLIGGGLGLHRFYLRNNGGGVYLCLLTCVGVAIWALRVEVFGVPIGMFILGGALGLLLVDLFTVPREVRRHNLIVLEVLEEIRDTTRKLLAEEGEEGAR